MIKIEMEAFRSQLLKLARQSRGDIATLEDEAFHETDGMAVGNLSNIPVEDRAELGADNISEETTIGLFENESERLGEINAALERIGEGTFGNCEECGQEISKDRLQAIPYARQCMKCARNAQKEKLASPGNL